MLLLIYPHEFPNVFVPCLLLKIPGGVLPRWPKRDPTGTVTLESNSTVADLKVALAKVPQQPQFFWKLAVAHALTALYIPLL